MQKTLQSIPLTNRPNQSFQVTMQINNMNVTLQFNLNWNPIAGYWVMSIFDSSIGETVLSSFPLVTGKETSVNILRPFGYMKIGKAYLISKTDQPETDYPDAYNMQNFYLLWDDND